ncbi:MAG TPA: hypothetical protein QGF58_02560 [Myxococcota bacterium]|nr:hypothetical protein [Myxococcota bacterium]
MRWLLLVLGLTTLSACSQPCARVTGNWSGEFWGDSLEGEIDIDFTANGADATRGSFLGTWTPSETVVEEPNLSGLYSCPGEGQLEGLYIDWESEGDGGVEQVYGQLFGYISSKLEADGNWEADWWTEGGLLIGMYEGEWSAWHESSY